MSVEDAPTIGVASTNLEADVVHVITAWATAFPWELFAFDRQMKLIRKSAHKKNGITPAGNLRRFGDMPTRLYRAMQLRYGKDWDRDQKLLKLFWRNFTVGKIDRYSEAYKAVEQ